MAGIAITIDTDLGTLEPDIRRAGKLALRGLSDSLRDGHRDYLRGKLDDPTPYTEDSLYVVGTPSATPELLVGVKDRQAEYLQCAYRGGHRDRTVTPTLDASLDGHGIFRASILRPAPDVTAAPEGAMTPYQQGVWRARARMLKIIAQPDFKLGRKQKPAILSIYLNVKDPHLLPAGGAACRDAFQQPNSLRLRLSADGAVRSIPQGGIRKAHPAAPLSAKTHVGSQRESSLPWSRNGDILDL